METVYRIMIVDDNHDIISTIQGLINLLDESEHAFYSYQDGKSALDASKEITFDLIITDYIMPGIDGLELITNIRETNNPNSNVPIILLTSFDPKDLIVSLKEYEKCELLRKPIDYDLLSHFVKSMIFHRRESACF